MPKSAAAKARRRAKRAGLGKAGKKIAKAAIVAKAVDKVAKLQGHGDYVPSAARRLKGRGDFQSLLGGIGSTIGGLGDAGLRAFKSITGMGDYRERAAKHQLAYENSGIEGATTSAFSNPNPMIMGAMSAKFGGGPPTVSHREYVGDIIGSINFKTQTFPIQPGLRGPNVLLPWLSSLASNFSQYELHGMILEFVSTSTDFSSSTSLGSVTMSTNYDAGGSPFASEREVNNSEFATTNKPSCSFIHPIECASKESPITIRYVRSSNTIVTEGDLRFDDVGLFQISTVGQPVDGAVIGQLWVTYKFGFLKPLMPDFHAGTTATAVGSAVAHSARLAYNTDFVFNPNSSYPVSITGSNRDTVQLPVGYAGTYQMTVFMSGNGAALPANAAIAIASAKSDITFMPIMPLAVAYGNNGASAISAAYTSGGFGPTANYPAVSGTVGAVFTTFFSTIGSSLANNQFYLVTTNIPDNTVVNLGVFFTAVDNDIQHTLTGMAAMELEIADMRESLRLLLESNARIQTRNAERFNLYSASAPPPPSLVTDEERKDETESSSDELGGAVLLSRRLPPRYPK